MTQERKTREVGNKTGGQISPQFTSNTRTTDYQSKQQFDKNSDVFKSRVARMRIENDLYERQSS